MYTNMVEQTNLELIKASKLFKDLADASLTKNLEFGLAYLEAIATEFKDSKVEDKVNKKPYSETFSEFLNGIQNYKIGIVGDEGVLQRIKGDVPAFGMAITYQKDDASSKKDFPVVVMNRHIRELTKREDNFIDITSGIEAISGAVHTMNSIPVNMQINGQEIPDEVFLQYGVTPLLNRTSK